MPDSPSETRHLLGAWRGGDRTALSALLERDLPWIKQHVRRRLGTALRQRMDSEDVVQEAVVEFLRHGPPFVLSDQDQFRRLAAHVVRNVLGHQYERFTAQRRELQRERPLPSEDLLDLDAPGHSPSQVAHRNEREACVRLGLELLELEDREALLLREWEHLSFAEIGSRLKITEDAARMRFNRAVRRLATKVRQLRSGRLEESLDD